MDADGPNETIRRFGHPATLIAETDAWVLLLRPDQPTLGSMILAAKGTFTAFGDLPPAAFADFGRMVGRIEAALRATVAPAKINYLMLMMVDPHVHFHILPRYAGERSEAGLTVADAGWPKQPDLASAKRPDANQVQALCAWLRAAM
ncbi:HIT family protein [Sphingomonas sp.]|uniref:HIT family protein n=1 Tax=Sphingomonas sp. TaxID=28214 RepID=UPI000DAF7566|nr:HIT family protein [Sphingomonas sp.]PZU10026.1 MAG: HIT family protein [Sphingomonas sp.]